MACIKPHLLLGLTLVACVLASESVRRTETTRPKTEFLESSPVHRTARQSSTSPKQPQSDTRRLLFPISRPRPPRDSKELKAIPSDTNRMPYNYEYNVHDDHLGTHFGHKETGVGNLANGKYYVHLPDGRVQTVTYYTDEEGFHPDIVYNGADSQAKTVHNGQSSPRQNVTPTRSREPHLGYGAWDNIHVPHPTPKDQSQHSGSGRIIKPKNQETESISSPPQFKNFDSNTQFDIDDIYTDPILDFESAKFASESSRPSDQPVNVIYDALESASEIYTPAVKAPSSGHGLPKVISGTPEPVFKESEYILKILKSFSEVPRIMSIEDLVSEGHQDAFSETNERDPKLPTPQPFEGEAPVPFNSNVNLNISETLFRNNLEILKERPHQN